MSFDVDAAEVTWEVWEDDLCVASSTDEADARHYLAVYSQDGPTRLVRAETRRFDPALRSTAPAPSEVEAEAFKRAVHNECSKHAEATVVAGSFSQGYATAWEDAARILPDRLAALSRPSDKTVELLSEAREGIAALRLDAFYKPSPLDRYDDESPVHINWPGRKTAPTSRHSIGVFKRLRKILGSIDSHLGEMK